MGPAERGALAEAAPVIRSLYRQKFAEHADPPGVVTALSFDRFRFFGRGGALHIECLQEIGAKKETPTAAPNQNTRDPQDGSDIDIDETRT